MNKTVLYIIVAISGASVLALEILGTRILGPFYGVSLFLWSSLITVTLAGLSVGYFIGGLIADKNGTQKNLFLTFAASGIWIVLIPWLKHPVLFLTEPVGLRFAVLVTSFVLFFPPLTLLGMVSPFAIKLKTKALSEVGRSAGNLFAVSTIASVVSALLTGFFLIPFVGVMKMTLLTGFVVILTAGIGLFSEKKGFQPYFSLFQF